jgi:four helix bundle protein
MEKIQSFKDLRIWNLGVEIVTDVYAATRDFPREEIYGLTSQVRRAAVSVPANIAEGFRRYSPKEHKQYLHIAMGSLAEMETELIIAQKLGLIAEEKMRVFSEKIDHLSRMITAFMKKFK